MRTEARLTLKGWTQAFGPVEALRGLDLDVAPGERGAGGAQDPLLRAQVGCGEGADMAVNILLAPVKALKTSRWSGRGVEAISIYLTFHRH